MAQIFGQNIGSPFAIVDTDGDLHVKATISGNIIIGSVSANVDSVYIQSGNNLIGSFYPLSVEPTNVNNNPLIKLEYIISGTSTGVTGSEIGNIVKYIGAGSYVQTLTYADNLITNIGSWT